MDYYVIIAGAGAGHRFRASTPKLLQSLSGEPIIARTIRTVIDSRARGFVLVCPADNLERFRQIAENIAEDKLFGITTGGAERTDSVKAGLSIIGGICKPDDIILIHDGARPLAPPELFDLCAEAACKHGAAIAAVPVTDTIKLVEDGIIIDTPRRDRLWAAQTPQAFKFKILAAAIQSDTIFTDDAAAVEAMKMPVHIVQGSNENIKITTKLDINIAEAIIDMRKGENG